MVNRVFRSDRLKYWRQFLAAAWVLLIAVLYFLRQVPPQWQKVVERFIVPLLGR